MTVRLTPRAKVTFTRSSLVVKAGGWQSITALLLTIGLLGQAAVLHRRRTAQDFPTISQIEIGDTLPNVTMRENDGEETVLGEAMSGCAVVLLFRSTCPACQRAAPGWRRVSRVNVAGIGMPVVWLGHEGDEDAKTWHEQHELSPAYLLDDVGWAAIGATYVPKAYIVSPDPVVLRETVGQIEHVTANLPPSDVQVLAANCNS